MITVKVIRKETGLPEKNHKVFIARSGPQTLGLRGSKVNWTNERGETQFDMEPCEGIVNVDGRNLHIGRIDSKVVIYI
ncbi:hypothetical protein BST81_04865 [Leptolyngbya sp. 'hensonii']|uniref:hypothetical protein n=1 Tax=Leptolyngbya sp. 'hensonii' TaxID=1922337 RepID=UPI00094FCBD8|nr:hypothetical protein [Leptolyngbya sp. 'hensonii']OLP19595.1 hypothetical protein BST81_04865 [Leptolyngbya sp. 'hensonii']